MQLVYEKTTIIRERWYCQSLPKSVSSGEEVPAQRSGHRFWKRLRWIILYALWWLPRIIDLFLA